MLIGSGQSSKRYWAVGKMGTNVKLRRCIRCKLLKPAHYFYWCSYRREKYPWCKACGAPRLTPEFRDYGMYEAKWLKRIDWSMSILACDYPPHLRLKGHESENGI